MIILLSLGGSRMLLLRLPNSSLAKSSSHEVLAKKSSSSEDKAISITRIFPEGPPCSNTREKGRHEEISDGDPDGGGDPDGTSRGVLVSLCEGLTSSEGEHSRLVPLLSSIDGKRGQEE
jgi:hypothetical protein